MDRRIYLVMTFLFLLCFLSLVSSDKVIDLNSYKYPLPEDDGADTYTIAIVGTNDVHGQAFPKQLINPTNQKPYLYGGLEYMSSYIKVIRNDFKDRFLWLDGGDQFQGTIENFLSKGEIITDFYNTANVNASVVGNHEFDFGRDFLNLRMNNSIFDYLVSNIYNNLTNLPYDFPHSKVVNIYNVGKIKVGVIGLTTIETLFTTSGDLSNLKFLDYKEIVIKLSNDLRKAGANLVLITSHVGVQCPNEPKEKMKLLIRDSTTTQAQCRDTDEMPQLLESLPKGTVDGVFGGHIHDVVHHWFSGVPMVQNINGGFYFHVVYFTFDKNNKLVDSKIEGPIPVCEKIFENTKNCRLMNTNGDEGDLVNFKFHDKLIAADPAVTEKFAKWLEPVKPYKEIIAQTDLDLIGSNDFEHILGDVVTDAMKFTAKADVSILNEGALRTFWTAGPITFEDIFNMFPFNNYLVSVEMSGAELLKVLEQIQGGKKAFYPTSGLVQKLSMNPKREFISATLNNGVAIVYSKIYTVALVDFLINGKGGDDFTEVLKWYTPRNRKNLGLFRDVMRDYMKGLGKITKSIIDPKNPRITIVDRTKFLFDETLE